jgi:hypothetical protein
MKQRTGVNVPEVWCVFITSGVEVCCLAVSRFPFFLGESSPLCEMNSNIEAEYFIYLYITVSCSVYIDSKCISC